MLSAVIFDLDGTLMDTAPGVLQAVQYTIKKMNLKPLQKEEILKFIGPPVKQSFLKYCLLTEEEANYATSVFRERYSTVDLFGADVYDGIFTVLQCLRDRGLKIGVATYKREDYAIRLLQEKGIAAYCQSMKGADDQGRKSKNDILLECLDSLNIKDPNTAILIGDTEHDSAGAEKAGVKFLGVTYGYGFKNVQDILGLPFAIGAACHPLEILDLL